MTPLVIAALLASAECAAPPAAASVSRPRLFSGRPAVARDATIAAGASVAVAMIKPDIRRAIVRDGSLENVLDNFTAPVARVRAGTRRDTDPFWINNVAHPLSFGMEALYLKHQGYSDGAAFLFTQVHSVVWEFVVEGCAFEPSGKDLLADAAGAAAAIWIVHPIVRRWTGPEAPVSIALRPHRGGAALQVGARF